MTNHSAGRLRRCGCLLFCALLCGALLSGCLPAAKESTPQTAVGEKVSAMPDDGKLRIYYDSRTYSGVIFCGATLLYSGAWNESTYLLTDDADGSTDYYVASYAQGSQKYVHGIYNRSGTCIYRCETGADILGLAGGWLLTGRSYNGSSYDTSRFVNLKTGVTREGPASAMSFFAPSSGRLAVVTLNTASPDGPDSCTYSTELLDLSLQPVRTFEGQLLSSAEYLQPGLPAGWALLSAGGADTADTSADSGEDAYAGGYVHSSLYNVDSGTELTGLFCPCGGRYACFAGDSGYFVRDLATQETVYTCSRPCLLFLGNRSLYAPDAGSEYSAVRLNADGTQTPVLGYDVNSEDGTAAVLTAQALEVYSAGGSLLYSVAADPHSDGEENYSYVTALTQGRCMLESDDLSGSTHYTVYTDSRTSFATDAYLSLYEETSGRLVGFRYGRSGTALYDLLDFSGNVLCADISSINGLAEDGMLPIRRGFTEGWADESGRWLWSRSIWQSPTDETSANY